jgi:signal transduction histidine kinase
MQYAAQLDINPLNTHDPFHTQTLELMPIVNQLNAMQHGLDDALARERQFSSDVAHELRTPLAELRTLVEVGSRWPDDRDAVVEYFADARAICEQMEGVVISLLTLTRCESGVQPVQREPFNVLDAVETSWLAVKQLAQEKTQAFECHIPATLEMVSDRDMLLTVLRSLLGNAVCHSAPKSTIRCTVTNLDSRPQLTISNPIEHLNSEDVPYLFERFWRKDSARSDGHHSGLGLSIVKAFSDLLNLEVQACVDERKAFRISISL